MLVGRCCLMLRKEIEHRTALAATHRGGTGDGGHFNTTAGEGFRCSHTLSERPSKTLGGNERRRLSGAVERANNDPTLKEDALRLSRMCRSGV